MGSPADNAPESHAEKSPFGEMDATQARAFTANPTNFLESLAAELSLQPEFEGKQLWTTHVSVNASREKPEEEQAPGSQAK